jgi:hypothetical protein
MSGKFVDSFSSLSFLDAALPFN